MDVELPESPAANRLRQVLDTMRAGTLDEATLFRAYSSSKTVTAGAGLVLLTNIGGQSLDAPTRALQTLVQSHVG